MKQPLKIDPKFGKFHLGHGRDYPVVCDECGKYIRDIMRALHGRFMTAHETAVEIELPNGTTVVRIPDALCDNCRLAKQRNEVQKIQARLQEGAMIGAMVYFTLSQSGQRDAIAKGIRECSKRQHVAVEISAADLHLFSVSEKGEVFTSIAKVFDEYPSHQELLDRLREQYTARQAKQAQRLARRAENASSHLPPPPPLDSVRHAAAQILHHGHRVLAKRYHPDVAGGDTKSMKLLNEALSYLRERLPS
jgi:hypothetical protein